MDDYIIMEWGNIIYPSLNTKNYNLISKFGKEYGEEFSIVEEFNNIKRLPIELTFYPNPNMSELKHLNEKDTEYIKTKFSLNDEYIIELTQEFIHGDTIIKYLDILENSLNDNDYFNKFINFLRALIILYYNIELLNDKYNIFHNDLNGGNLIYNGNEIKIIDFEYATFDKPLKMTNKQCKLTDKEYMLEWIKNLLVKDYINNDIKKYLIDNNIIYDNIGNKSRRFEFFNEESLIQSLSILLINN
jgi:hypothetical protein